MYKQVCHQKESPSNYASYPEPDRASLSPTPTERSVLRERADRIEVASAELGDIISRLTDALGPYLKSEAPTGPYPPREAADSPIDQLLIDSAGYLDDARYRLRVLLERVVV